MKISRIKYLTLLFVLMGACGESEPDDALRVLGENYPRAYFFRLAENTTAPYEEWEANINRLMGIQGKAMDEEIVGRTERNIDYFTRFKQNHPDQLVLLHFNGNARDPRFRRESFFAGHWLYFNGAEILSDVPAGEKETTIRVTDASLFKLDIGRYGDRKEDIGLCLLDEDGKPDWNVSEQVRLISADPVNNTITVERACYGTEAIAFSSGQAYAAAHVHEGPWGEKNHLMWHYNYSTACPVDPEGKTCRERLASEITAWFGPGGELEAFDGLQFDVLYSDIAWPRYQQGDERLPDIDADGIGDRGILNGINEYGLGVRRFLADIRKGLGPERLILADGHHGRHQRGFGLINGIESEGWPDGSDHNLYGWSGGINRHLFWLANSAEPPMSYINHRWWVHHRMDTVLPLSTERLVIAASCLTGSAIAFSDRPEPEEGDTLFPIWDELVKGTEKQPGWLGRPLGPAIQLARSGKELVGSQQPLRLLEKLADIHTDLIFMDEPGFVMVDGMGSVRDNLEFMISEIPSPGKDLTIYLTLKANPMEGYPVRWGRKIHVSIPGHSIAGQEKNYYPENLYMSWVNDTLFESVFYFPGLDNMEKVDVNVEVEGTETVWIKNIYAYAAPDARVRAFENGVVLANPSPHSFTFMLEELFPGKEFKRLKGSSRQDPVTNDGSIVDGNVEIPAKDALFLVTVK